jgi:hypothetical protein
VIGRKDVEMVGRHQGGGGRAGRRGEARSWIRAASSTPMTAGPFDNGFCDRGPEVRIQSLQRRVRSELVPVEVWPTPSEPNWFSAAVYIAIAPPSTWISEPVM